MDIITNQALIKFDESQLVTINGETYLMVDMAAIRAAVGRKPESRAPMKNREELRQAILHILRRSESLTSKEIWDQVTKYQAVDCDIPALQNALRHLRDKGAILGVRVSRQNVYSINPEYKES